jgi:1,2-phenylacetyl-CoA epoxidase catalytic subunit
MRSPSDLPLGSPTGSLPSPVGIVATALRPPRWPVSLLFVAEDRFLHGHLLARWITDYIDIEESLAVGSIAQEELAHAATLIEFAGLDAGARDAFIYERPTDQWRPTALVAHRLLDWPATVLRGYLLASIGMVGSLLLSGAKRPEVSSAGEVMAAEQRLHVMHWQRWLTLLGDDAATAAELRSRSAAVLPLACDVFGAPAFTDTDGISAHQAWIDTIAKPLAEVDIEVDVLGAEPRPRQSQPDSDLTAILGDIRAERSEVTDGVRGLYR